MSDDWTETLNEKISELELLRSWASIVGYVSVTESINQAIQRLKKIRDVRLENLAAQGEIVP